MTTTHAQASTSLPLKIAAWAIALGLVALPVVGIVNGWFASDRWPFRRLEVDAEFARVSAEQVRGAVAPHVDVGFFAVDLDAVRLALEALPWVESVQVRKRWPDRLEVRIAERRAAAVWSDERLVSTAGQLFSVPGAAPEGLPRLSGPEDHVRDVLAFHAKVDGALDGTGLDVTSVELSGRGSWTLELSNGALVVVGREAPDARLGRFIETLPRIEAAPNTVWTRADLRYANGFALEFREVAPPPSAPIDEAATPTPAATPQPTAPQA